ncbi:MAG TPA: hypothetical protein VGD30_06325 [Telluria sp.]
MRTLQPSRRPRLAFAAAALAASFLLAGCGSDNDDDRSTPPPTAPAPAPTPPMDAFIAFVKAQVASMLDTTEPVSIDSVTATTPDNTEPEPVQ